MAAVGCGMATTRYAAIAIPSPANCAKCWSKHALDLAPQRSNERTPCLAKGHRAFVSHHIGDLESYETLGAYRACIDHFRRLFGFGARIVWP